MMFNFTIMVTGSGPERKKNIDASVIIACTHCQVDSQQPKPSMMGNSAGESRTHALSLARTHRSILLPCALRRPAWLPDGGIFGPVAFTACESLCCSFLTSMFESGSTGAKSDQCGLNCRLDEAYILVVRPAVGAHGVTRFMGLPFRMAICADAHGEIQYGRSPTILLLGVGT